MNKKDFKKMLAAGLAGGAVLASQNPMTLGAHEVCETAETSLARGGCGNGSGASCGGYKPQASHANQGKRYYTADNDQTMQQQPTRMQSQYSGQQFDQRQQDQRQQQQYYSDQGGQVTEDQLYSQLSEEGKALWNGLDQIGKERALQLASQPQFANKNEAVKLAAQEAAHRRYGK